jgi:hypothetical protein
MTKKPEFLKRPLISNHLMDRHCLRAILKPFPTGQAAERCDLTIDTDTYHFPEFKAPDGMALNDYFEEPARTGLTRPAIKVLYSEFGETSSEIQGTS